MAASRSYGTVTTCTTGSGRKANPASKPAADKPAARTRMGAGYATIWHARIPAPPALARLVRVWQQPAVLDRRARDRGRPGRDRFTQGAVRAAEPGARRRQLERADAQRHDAHDESSA